MSFRKQAGLAGALALLCSGSVLAQQSFMESWLPADTHITIGVKGWLNRWQTSTGQSAAFPGGTATQIPAVTSSDRVAAIPSINVRSGNWNFGVSYFTPTSYSFPRTTTFVEGFGGACPFFTCAVQLGFDIRSKREEVNLDIGYSILPNVTVGIGYKRQKQTANILETILAPIDPTTGRPAFHFGSDVNNITFNLPEHTTRLTSWILGLNASAPLGTHGLNLYANAAAGPSYGDSGLGHGYYASAEAGVVMPISLGFGTTALSLAYKTQIIELKGPVPFQNERLRDTTNGLILGLSQSF